MNNMATEREQIQRLKEEQEIALEDTNSRIHQLEDFAKDYKSLQRKLSELPDKLTHNIMVPFGKYAFMPGQLVHTNELLVLLGDNWFAERSAKQAIDIAGRRVKALGEQITNLEKQRDLLQPRLSFTSELENLQNEKQDLFEIKENFDEAQEAEWKEKHRESVRSHKRALREQRENTVSAVSGTTSQTDEDLWKRLEELEHQERKNREMYRNYSTEESSLAPPEKVTSSKTTTKQTVRWEDEEKQEDTATDDYSDDDTEDDDDDDDDYDDYDDGDDEGEDDEITSVSGHRPTTISFRHTKPGSSNDEEVKDISAPQGAALITSPADIYNMFVKPALDKPRSILKSSGSPELQTYVSPPEQKEPDVVEAPEPEKVKTEAFTGSVVEKDAESPDQSVLPSGEHATQQNPATKLPSGDSVSDQAIAEPSTVAEQDPQQPKRVSRFKAQRMKKTS